MDGKIRQEAILLYDRFTHEGMERREFVGRMAALVGGAAAAESLIAAIAASPAAAAVVPADDPRIFTRTQHLIGGYEAYVAELRRRAALLNSALGWGDRNPELDELVKAAKKAPRR